MPRDAAEGCELLVLPTTPDALSLAALMQTIQVLNDLGSGRFCVLLTIVPPKPVPEGQAARKALLDAGLPVFKREIRRTIVFQRAASQGVTVDQITGEMAGMGWRDYEAVGKEIEAIHGKAKVQGI